MTDPAPNATAQLDYDLRRRWSEVVPLDYRESALPDVDVNARATIEAWLRLVTDDVDDPHVCGPNLVISGPVSCGKTYSGFAAMRTLHFDGTPSCQRWAKGRPLRRAFGYWSVPVALMRLRSREGGPAFFDELVDIGVLFLDDIGSVAATDWTRENLFGLLNERRSRRRPIVTTTNLDQDGLQAHLGELSYTRLVDNAVFVEMRGRNRRQRRLEVLDGGEQ